MRLTTVEKPFKTFDEQLVVLEKRNMIINNRELALQILSTENYYNVINGYKELFLDKDDIKKEKFKENTEFEEVYSLYEFDRAIGITFLKYLLKVESIIKTSIAYVFAEKHGSSNYLKYENFDVSSSKKGYQQVGNLISNLHRDISGQIDKNKAVTHYVKNHGYLPPWILVNILTFGRVSKFYSNLKQNDRQNISKRIGNNIFENELKNYLEFLSIMRNLCAHNERLFNYKCHVSLMHNSIYDKLKFNNTRKNDLFAVVVCLKIVLNKKDFESLYIEIDKNINDLKKTLKSITINCVTNEMGFPENWREIINY